MSTVACEQTQQLVKSLELVDEVRNALAAASMQSSSAHETAVISAADLAEAIEQMILDRQSEHARESNQQITTYQRIV